MKMRKRILQIHGLAVCLLLAMGLSTNALALNSNEEHYHLKLLGKFVFFDNISSIDGVTINGDMSCATCHVPSTGGTGGDARVNRGQVAISGANSATIGSLKPPTNAYATFIPPFRQLGGGPNGCGGATGFCGGNFWNGRSIGDGGDTQVGSTHVILADVLGTKTEYAKYLGPTADQALNPFPNNVEQNVPDGNDHALPGSQAVCNHVKAAAYGSLYYRAWGEYLDCDTENVEVSFQRIAIALSAYQSSTEVNSFSSKRDVALRKELACLNAENQEALLVRYAQDAADVVDVVAPYYDASFCDQLAAEKPEASWGKFPLVMFTDEENFGHDMFYDVPFGPGNNPNIPTAACSICHLSDRAHADGTGLFERYADDAYHNIGTPKNYELTNPVPDDLKGLAGHTGNLDHRGELKAPTLRNVDKRSNARFIKAYASNGWFKSLESIVHFYNTSRIGFPTAITFGITACPSSIKTESLARRYNCWPAPEVPETVAPPFLVGNLGLTAANEAALVAYIKTLTDTVTAVPPTLDDLYAALGDASE